MSRQRSHVWLASVAALAIGGWALADQSNLPFCLVPSADTMIDQQNPDQNYGAAEEIQIRSRQNTVSFDTGQEIATLVKFDLSPVPESPIASAKLYFFYSDWVYSDPADRNLACYRITSIWSEEGVTWRRRPDTAAEATDGTIVPTERGAWLVFDVTEDVRAMLAGEARRYGWMIKDEFVSDGGGGSQPFRPDPCTCFHAEEYGQLVPYLMIETTCAADVNADGAVDFKDLLSIMNSWGGCP